MICRTYVNVRTIPITQTRSALIDKCTSARSARYWVRIDPNCQHELQHHGTPVTSMRISPAEPSIETSRWARRSKKRNNRYNSVKQYFVDCVSGIESARKFTKKRCPLQTQLASRRKQKREPEKRKTDASQGLIYSRSERSALASIHPYITPRAESVRSNSNCVIHCGHKPLAAILCRLEIA